MSKSLVIVESPAKAKTINKYLGNEYIVKSSVGHIRDLPTSGSGKAIDTKARAAAAALTRKMAPEEKVIFKKKKAKQQLVKRMGIDPEQDWAAQYEILPGKEKVVAELKKLAKNADHIYLATDLDREGEAIAWHLQEAIGGDPDRYKRVVFNEITKKAITDAFKEPGEARYALCRSSAGATILRPGCGFHGFAIALGQGGARPVGGSCAIGSCASRCRARTGDSRVHSRGILGSLRKARYQEERKAALPDSKTRAAAILGPTIKPIPMLHLATLSLPTIRCSSARIANFFEAEATTDHLDLAAGREHQARLRCKEDDDDGAAALRSRLYNLYAYRLDPSE